MTTLRVRIAVAVLLVSAASIAHADQINGFNIDNSLVPRELIKSGGPPRDGIPSIDSPRFVSAADAGDLSDTDRVLGVRLGGLAKAYPIKILNYHEIVNDHFNDVPVAITFCPLCGTGVAFEAEVDGQPRQFGVSGLLYNSNVLMYDRKSESLWSQIIGQAVTGPARGQQLKPLPVRHTTWLDWRKRNPDTLVLEPPTSFNRNYNVNPYMGYAKSAGVWAPVAHRDDRYHSKAVVIGIVLDDHAYAWPFVELPEDRDFITDTVNGQTVRLEYDHATQAATVLDSNGQEIPSFTVFWFAWIAFHPDTGVYGKD